MTVFLKNPEKQNDGKYLATEVDYEEAARIIGNKTTYGNETSDIIDIISKRQIKFENSKYVPIFCHLALLRMV